MSLKIVLLLTIASGLVGIAFGYFLRWIISLGKKGSVELEIKQRLFDANDQAKRIVTEAEGKVKILVEEGRKDLKEKENTAKKVEERLIKKEEFLDHRQIDIDKEVENWKQKIAEVRAIKEKTEGLLHQREEKLEKLSELTKEEAKLELLKIVERNYEGDILVRMQKLETQNKEKLDRKARDILTTSIQRLATSVSSDIMTTLVAIPSDEAKGKIIGKEGRNIKAFERATGVEVIIDDTPGSITLSSFDSVRRQIAKTALENLILDGRIQPAKIEDIVEKSKEEIAKVIREKGEQAAYECGVYNLDPR